MLTAGIGERLSAYPGRQTFTASDVRMTRRAAAGQSKLSGLFDHPRGSRVRSSQPRSEGAKRRRALAPYRGSPRHRDGGLSRRSAASLSTSSTHG